MTTGQLTADDMDIAEIRTGIGKLKKERNALILAHNYQLNEVQDVADHVGDSYYLSKVAANTDYDVIVFCGVRFMAETASILSPDKLVLLPESDAGCPLADMITDSDVRDLKRRHPGAPVVCYINSSAEVKAESDVCCTSSNALRITSLLNNEKVIFVPDENLGNYVARKLPDKKIVLWRGRCPVHARVKAEDVLLMRGKHPGALVLVHPECMPEVVELADYVGSTADIIRQAEASDVPTLIIGTEIGVLHHLKHSSPEKQIFILQPDLVCPDMKKTSLRSVYESLANDRHPVQVPEILAEKARRAITRMLETVQ